MLTSQLKDALKKLRDGKMDIADAKMFEQIPADELLADLRRHFPFVFQERVIGRKHEIGMARNVGLVTKVQVLSNMPIFFLVPTLVKCVLLSSYDDAISEVTRIPYISVDPSDHNAIKLETAPGNKLDKRPDGWRIRSLKRKTVRLKVDFLLKRGWKFDSLNPAGLLPQP